jgi:hypothetical protein
MEYTSYRYVWSLQLSQNPHNENNRRLNYISLEAIYTCMQGTSRILCDTKQCTISSLIYLHQTMHAAGRKPKAHLKRNKPKHNQILDDFILERSVRVPDCRGWPPLIRCPSGACSPVPAGARWCPPVPLSLPLLPAAAPVPDCRAWSPLIRCRLVLSRWCPLLPACAFDFAFAFARCCPWC